MKPSFCALIALSVITYLLAPVSALAGANEVTELAVNGMGGAAFTHRPNTLAIERVAREPGRVIEIALLDLSDAHPQVVRRLDPISSKGNLPCSGGIRASRKTHAIFVCSTDSEVMALDDQNLKTIRTFKVGVAETVVDFQIDQAHNSLDLLVTDARDQLKLVIWTMTEVGARTSLISSGMKTWSVAKLDVDAERGKIAVLLTVNGTSSRAISTIFLCQSDLTACERFGGLPAIGSIHFYDGRLLVIDGGTGGASGNCIDELEPGGSLSKKYCFHDQSFHYAFDVWGTEIAAISSESRTVPFNDEIRTTKSSLCLFDARDGSFTSVVIQGDYGGLQNAPRVVAGPGGFVLFEASAHGRPVYFIPTKKP